MPPVTTPREREVWEACALLWAEIAQRGGDIRELTGERIQQQLQLLGYVKGSPNYIYKYRASWREQHPVTEGNAPHAAFSEPIAHAVAAVQQRIQQEADERVQQVEAAASETVDEAKTAVQTLQEELSALESRFDILQTTHQATLTTLRTTEATLQTEREAKGRAETAERVLGVSLTQLKQMYDTHCHTQAQRETQREQAHEKTLARVHAQSDKALAAITAQRLADEQHVEKTLTHLKTQQDAYTTAMALMHNQYQMLCDIDQGRRSRMMQLQVQVTHLTEQITTLMTQKATLMTNNARLQTQDQALQTLLHQQLSEETFTKYLEKPLAQLRKQLQATLGGKPTKRTTSRKAPIDDGNA